MVGYRSINQGDFMTSFAEEFLRTKNTPEFIRKTGVFH